ncbi:hypothetical protein PVK06_034574 [Gossypium arboreum]|uniref:Uncharacterized protein n=1 Tax=Gossypium arboreum TaxID=29729 RepID=A0ABR0NHI0_GOSAR|nr:hypothetical protein PVK06_034574 [Gossypium arboreum]
MAPEVVLRSDSPYRSSNTSGQTHPLHTELESTSCVFSKKIKHFPKHDTVKLGLLIEYEFVQVVASVTQANLINRQKDDDNHSKQDSSSGHSRNYNQGFKHKVGSRGTYRGRGHEGRFDEKFSRLLGDQGQSMSINYHSFDNQSGSESQNCSGELPRCFNMQSCCGAPLFHNKQPSSTTYVENNSRVYLYTLPDQAWYPDSEATKHVTNDMSMLTSVVPDTSMSKVMMGNGQSIPMPI